MQLNHMISIERRAQQQDAAGQVRETWQRVADVWASVRPIGGREFYAASGQRAEISHEIILRHGADIQPQDRILYDGREFDVRVVLNLNEQNRYLKIMSVENASY